MIHLYLIHLIVVITRKSAEKDTKILSLDLSKHDAVYTEIHRKIPHLFGWKGGADNTRLRIYYGYLR